MIQSTYNAAANVSALSFSQSASRATIMKNMLTSPSGLPRQAISAPSPPVLPADDRFLLYGFTVLPNTLLSHSKDLM
jgi:hypothetical protein